MRKIKLILHLFFVLAIVSLSMTACNSSEPDPGSSETLIKDEKPSEEPVSLVTDSSENKMLAVNDVKPQETETENMSEKTNNSDQPLPYEMQDLVVSRSIPAGAKSKFSIENITNGGLVRQLNSIPESSQLMESGSVVVRVKADAEGNVTQANVIEDHELTSLHSEEAKEEALRLARKCKFEPDNSGNAVTVEILLIEF